VVSLGDRLYSGEIAVLLHGAIPNANGAPVVDRWAVVIHTPDGKLDIEEVAAFFARTRFAENTPNRPLADLSAARAVIPDAVARFQSHLVELRNVREQEVEHDLNQVLDRLGALEVRFKAQLEFNFGEQPTHEDALTPAGKRRLARRKLQEDTIERLFSDWADWFERTRRMVADPKPHVDVKAVFVE